jgi:hypothetical protein
MQIHDILVAVLASMLTAAPSSACSLRNPIPSATDLLRSSEVIVRAQARRVSATPGVTGMMTAADSTQVDFVVLEVLKGVLPSQVITFNGHLEERDDPSDRPIPYDFVRLGGRAGNCYALGYRQGAEYLLLLRRAGRSYAQGDLLTPYWSPLAPANEQLFGAEDPWLLWVREELESQ